MSASAVVVEAEDVELDLVGGRAGAEVVELGGVGGAQHVGDAEPPRLA